ncbi:hypothetical protein [Streptomyces sp. MBT53]|nr:hypothetical protein [Streptomyces sp. MBT53]
MSALGYRAVLGRGVREEAVLLRRDIGVPLLAQGTAGALPCSG